MSKMDSLAFSLAQAKAMVDQLPNFLRSEQTFWPLGSGPGGRRLARLSLGQLILTLDDLRVQAEEMSPEQVRDFTALAETYESMQAERPANLEEKAWKELDQRLNLWKAYLDELASVAGAPESYATDVRHRVLLSRLQDLVSDGERLENLNDQLTALDSRLRGRFMVGPFTWHPRLATLYDERANWYLYGQLKPHP
jgi:hypothetical protein